MLNRFPLLLWVFEWEEERKRWKKARKRLKKAVKKAHAKVETKIDKREAKGPRTGENPTAFGNRLLNKQEKIRKKVFNQRRERLTGLQNNETSRFNDYVAADRVRRTREARGPMVRKMRPTRQRIG
jgi:hypothetical protein